MHTLPSTPLRPSQYEREAYRHIHRWRHPEASVFRAAAGWVQDRWGEVTDLVRMIPGVDWTIENVVAGLLQVTNEITQDTVWTEAIHDAYRKAGHHVRHPAHIRRLDLAHVDGVMGGLGDKYRALAAVEGAATGFAGASGIVPDLVALVALNLRAAGEHAAYCGFDVSDPAERLFALRILDYVSRSDSKAADVAMTPVLSAATRVAKTQSKNAMEQAGMSRAIEGLVKRLGIRLSEKKLAQIVPVTGAVVGSAFNTYYTDRVCRAAWHLYRERFLYEKYGPEVLAALT